MTYEEFLYIDEENYYLDGVVFVKESGSFAKVLQDGGSPKVGSLEQFEQALDEAGF